MSGYKPYGLALELAARPQCPRIGLFSREAPFRDPSKTQTRFARRVLNLFTTGLKPLNAELLNPERLLAEEFPVSKGLQILDHQLVFFQKGDGVFKIKYHIR